MKQYRPCHTGLVYLLVLSILISALGGLTGCNEIPGELPPADTSVPAPETTVAPETLAEPTLSLRVTDTPYGALGNGQTNDRAAIQAAIDAAEKAGGGTVILDAGRTFLSGNLVLKSNVTLFFEENAKLKQSPNSNDYIEPRNGEYVPTKPLYGHDVEGGNRIWNHAWSVNFPFVYAGEGTVNVKITGRGIIEMTRGKSCADTLHMCPIGMYETDGFEISEITVQNYSSYAIQPYQCRNGLIRGITIREAVDRNGDGISMVNCQNMRVTGCSLTTSDDTVYVCSAYRDPRKGYWCSSENPQPSRNIEIDHNVCRLTNFNCKTFAFIPFGASAPDLRDVEISNIYVHDNDLQTIGIWPDDPYDNVTASVPIKQVRFENNIYTKIQDNFYAAPISDISGLDCMTGMENGDFEHTGEVFWTLKKNTDPASAGAAENAVGQTGSWYGFIDRLEVGDAAIYQGLKLTAGVEYIFTADLQSSGDTCRMFVRDLDSGKLIAEQPFSHTAWTKTGLTFTVPKTGNYHIGIERGNARSGWARIDNASLTANVDPDLTTQGFTLFADCAATYERNGDGYRNELGFLFSAKVDGTVPAVRIYTTKNEQGTHYVSLWDDATGKLASKEIYVWEIISGYEGWREFKLPAAVKIEAGRKYVVSVSAGPDCLYMWGENQLAAPKENEYLCTYAKGGRYSNDAKLGRIPRGEAASNYFRDIVFVPEV